MRNNSLAVVNKSNHKKDFILQESERKKKQIVTKMSLEFFSYYITEISVEKTQCKNPLSLDPLSLDISIFPYLLLLLNFIYLPTVTYVHVYVKLSIILLYFSIT